MLIVCGVDDERNVRILWLCLVFWWNGMVCLGFCCFMYVVVGG